MAEEGMEGTREKREENKLPQVVTRFQIFTLPHMYPHTSN